VDAVAASCDARSMRMRSRWDRARDRMSEEWCECRSEVGWNGMKGMFMSASRAGPRSRDPRSRRVSLGFTGRDSSLMRAMCICGNGATYVETP